MVVVFFGNDGGDLENVCCSSIYEMIELPSTFQEMYILYAWLVVVLVIILMRIGRLN